MGAGVWGRRVAAAATVGMLAVAGVAGTSAAAPPDPGSTVLVDPAGANIGQVEVTDDAVYFVEYVWGDSFSAVTTLYRRPITTTTGGRAIGPAEVLGRMALDTSFAVHDGTVAYVRALDDRLVLRAPDGTETVPTWGDDPAMAAGVVGLSAEWLVVDKYPYDSPWYTLVDRQTGATYVLGALVATPAGYDWITGSGPVEVSDTRVLFGVQSWTDDTVETSDLFTGVYTVALGADGPVGAPTVLREVDDDGDTPGGGFVEPVGLDGDRVLWFEHQSDAGGSTAVIHWSDPPYSSPTSVDAGPGYALGQDGSTVVIETPLGTDASVTWVTPSGPDERLALDVAGDPQGVQGTIVTVRSFDGDVFLVDAAREALTIDPAPVPPLLPFTDSGTGDPFNDEILWLFDHGLVGGYPDGTFRPRASVNRDAMAAFLYRLAHDGADAPACTDAPFTDVPAAHPFCGEITWLADTGITTGWADGTFRPATPVSREALAAFLYRLTHDGADAPACTTAPYADVAVGQRFCGEISWLADTGITTGWPDGTFRPASSIERQAMAAFLVRHITASTTA